MLYGILPPLVPSCSDEGVSWAIQNGITLSRSTVRFFRHNDMAHLEEILKKENAAHAASKKPLNRRFIIAEAIYQVRDERAISNDEQPAQLMSVIKC